MVDKEIKKWIDGNLVAISNNLEELKELKITHEISEESKSFLDDNYISVELMKDWMRRNYFNTGFDSLPFNTIFRKLFIRYNKYDGHPIISFTDNSWAIKEFYINNDIYTYDNYYTIILDGVESDVKKFTNVKPVYRKELPPLGDIYMLFNYKERENTYGSLYTEGDLIKAGLIKG